MIALTESTGIAYQYGGLFITEEPWIHPSRQIDTYELIYVVAGHVYLQEEERRFQMEEGDALVLSPGKKHGGYACSDGKTSFYWIHFRLDGAEGLEESMGIRPGQVQSCCEHRLASFLKQLLHVANTGGYPLWAVDGALLLLLGELGQSQKNNAISQSGLLCEIAEWIRINSDKKLTVAQVAQKFQYNPDYISMRMRQAYGHSLQKHIEEERMKYIRNLLLNSDAPLKQIASTLGWENANQFFHFFRYHEGISPTQFRQMFYRTHWNKK